MRKLISAALIAIAMSGCAQIKKTQRVDALDAAVVTEQCKNPIIAEPFIMFTVPSFVFRHKDCAGIEDLFLLGYWVERSEYTDTLMHLLMLEYVRQLNLANIALPDGKQYGYVLLKHQNPSKDEPGYVFYEFVEVKN